MYLLNILIRVRFTDLNVAHCPTNNSILYHLRSVLKSWSLRRFYVKILLVDDNRTLTKLLSDVLQHKGIDCLVTNDGRNGLTLIEHSKFDAILLDLAMPDFNGYDIVEHLHKTGKIQNQKIILFTSLSITKEQIDKLLKMGVYACIKKPVKPEVLVDTIKGAVKI